jgi:hypothetical protein
VTPRDACGRNPRRYGGRTPAWGAPHRGDQLRRGLSGGVVVRPREPRCSVGDGGDPVSVVDDLGDRRPLRSGHVAEICFSILQVKAQVRPAISTDLDPRPTRRCDREDHPLRASTPCARRIISGRLRWRTTISQSACDDLSLHSRRETAFANDARNGVNIVLPELSRSTKPSSARRRRRRACESVVGTRSAERP